MFRTVFSLVAPVLLSVGIQVFPASPSDEYIQNLASLKVEKANAGPCGQHFLFSGSGKSGTVYFFSAEGGKDYAKPREYRMEEVEVFKVPDTNVPRLKILHRQGPIYPLARIIISPEEFDKAFCLGFASSIAE